MQMTSTAFPLTREDNGPPRDMTAEGADNNLAFFTSFLSRTLRLPVHHQLTISGALTETCFAAHTYHELEEVAEYVDTCFNLAATRP